VTAVLLVLASDLTRIYLSRYFHTRGVVAGWVDFVFIIDIPIKRRI